VERTTDEVVEIFDRLDVAAAPVANIAQVFSNPHYLARETIVEVEDDELGPVRTLAPHPRLSVTPGHVRWLGSPKGQDTDRILRDILGYGPRRIAELRETGAI
jgi:crotonobetainyl-CoA:carnitine CoA-transferase CaiB-like acyl-CoA transferase